MKPVIVIAEVKARSGQEANLRDAAMALLAPTRAEAGCVQYDLHVSDKNDGHVLFHEVWASREALDTHLKTPHLTAFVAQLASLAVAPPRIDTFTKIA